MAAQKNKDTRRQLAAPTLAPSSLVDCQNLNLAPALGSGITEAGYWLILGYF